jgi:hypothetical protein
VNPLQTLVSERMAELDLTYRRAAAKSGGKVSHATLNSIVTGKHSWRLDESTVEGIALALDVSVEQVREASGQAATSTATRFELPPRADRLGAKERKAVLAMVDALLTAAAAGDPPRQREYDPDEGQLAGNGARRRATD